GSDDNNQFWLRAHQFVGVDRHSTRILNSAKLNAEVAAFVETKLPYLREKGPVVCDRRRTGLGGSEVTDSIDLSDFLRAYNQRNRGHTAEQTYEFAPPHCRPRGLNLAHRIGSTCPLEGAPPGVRQCPLWVKSRHLRCNTSCPLYPQ